MDLKKLGEVLREKRERSGIPAAVLARRAGIGRTTLWALERGENPKTGKPSRPSKDKLERLAAALRLSPAEQAELLEMAGYEAGYSTVADARAGGVQRRRGALASPSLQEGTVEPVTVGQRIDAILAAEGLSQDEQEMLGQVLVAHASELARLIKATVHRSGNETPDRLS